MLGLDLIGAVNPVAATAPSKKVATASAVGLAVGVLGAVLWKKHRYLGFFGGALAGAGAGNLVSGDMLHGVVNLAAAGAGVFGSLKWKTHPFWGYVLPAGVISGVGLTMAK